MTSCRIPGSICQERNPTVKDLGTTARTRALPAGPVRVTPGELSEPAEPITSEDEETLRKVARMKKLAAGLGFPKAVAALEHFLGRSGSFVEIPASKASSVRKESEASHQQKLLKAVQSKFGAKTVLAMNALVSPQGLALAETKWPTRVTFEMDYKSGVERAGVSDDNLTYYGSQIKSVVQIEAVRKASTRCFVLQVVSWKSWVVDNYDWEGDKKFGGDNAMLRWLLPTQKQMNRLTRIGKAKSYQRSSHSWEAINVGQPWTVCYDDDDDIVADAKIRKMKIEKRQKLNAAELTEGALPDPSPAEEVRQPTNE
ncbi:MAG: hypothetical protein H6822_28470 [Planctomycetaceae bacterium]|nr:hypothetical protein [Planctomycetaceae bacterium]